MESRWGFMRPWMAPLRGLVDIKSRSKNPTKMYPNHSILSSRYNKLVFVRFSQQFDPQEIREAIVLLAMVAHVNAEAFEHVMIHYCELQNAKRLKLCDKRLLPLGFGLNTTEIDPGWKVMDVIALFANLDRPSAKFTATARTITAISIQQGDPLIPLDIPIFINLALKNLSDENTLVLFQRELMELREKYNGWRFKVSLSRYTDDQAVIPCCFSLQPLRFENSTMSASDAGIMGDIFGGERQLLVDEIDLRFALFPYVEFHAIDVQIIGEMYQRVFCHENSLPTINTLTPSFDYLRFLESLGRFSSILPETLAFAKITMPPEYHGHNPKYWEYIAYAFFTRQASAYSSISAVSLAGHELNTLGAEAFAAVLASSNPAYQVFRHQDISVNDTTNRLTSVSQRRMRLMSGTEVIIEPMAATENRQMWVLQTDVDGVRILEDTLDAMVLVPGFGVCTVRRDQLLPLDDDFGHRILSSSTPGITNLDLIGIHPSDGNEPLYRILELIGPKLTSFGFVPIRRQTISIHRLFQCCPNLNVLRLDNMNIDASEFLLAIHDNNMQLSELCCPFTNPQEILMELSDPASIFTRHLKLLTYRAQWGCYEEICALDSFDPMLGVNRRLECVVLKMPQYLYKKYKPLLERHDFAPLPLTAEPFPLHCKLAFLSILSPAFAFDQDVLSLIFSFAAERVRRRVHFIVYNN